MNREELNLETEYTNLMETLEQAKANYNGEEHGETQKALKDAEWAVCEFRMKWRGIRDYVNATQGAAEFAVDDGTAEPAPVKSGVNQTKLR